MQSTTRNLRALRAVPILVLAFLMAGAGAAPAPSTVASNPNANQVLAAATAAPDRATLGFVDQAPAVRASGIDPAVNGPDRRIAQLSADAAAQAAAEERAEARAEAKAKERAKERAKARAAAKAAARADEAPRNSGSGKSDRDDDSPSYGGTNHIWMPSLGINYRVHTYACSRSDALANVIYRWGCAGNNNVYIMGHAWGVMDGLHDAYVSGNLSVGMTATYANGSGQVTKYRVTTWRVVDPSNSSWAIASQSQPSMTLQTCVGKNGQNRLVVRLVAVN